MSISRPRPPREGHLEPNHLSFRNGVLYPVVDIIRDGGIPMEHISTRQPMRQILVLCLAIFMIISAIPFTFTGGEEANEFTTIVLTPNKEFKVGDFVTIEIRFFDRDTPTDADDINITLGYPDLGSGRYIEVDENDSKVETGFYRVTFTIEEGDDPWDMGTVYGEVRCTVSSGRSETSAYDDLSLRLERDDPVELVIRVIADKPIFMEGDTVRFYVRYTYNGSYVDPDDPETLFLVNGKKTDILLIRESEGVYYYDYVSPEDGESKRLQMEASGEYNGSFAYGEGEANLDHFQIWLNTEIFNSTGFEGRVGVCSMMGGAMDLEVSVIYQYLNEDEVDVVKQIDGSTGSDGLLDILLSFEDIMQNRGLDITIWANESSRGENHQYAHTELYPEYAKAPGEGFDIIIENEQFFLAKDTTYTFNYTAYDNGTILSDTEIFFYFYTSPWLVSMELGNDGEMGELYHVGSAVTDENGAFSVQFTTPNKTTVITDLFKADFSEARGPKVYEVVTVSISYVDIENDRLDDLDFDVSNLERGESASVTITRDGQDSGRGGVHLHVFDPEMVTEDILDLGNWKEIDKWLYVNQHPFQYQIPFSGDSFTYDIGVPKFIPEDYELLLFAGMFEDDGTQDGRMFIDAYLSSGPSDEEDILFASLRLTEDFRGSTVFSEDEVLGIITVTANGSVIEDVDVIINITGAGSSNISAGITDENGNLTFLLTADNATNDAKELTIYVNVSKEGYQNGSIEEVVTVDPYIPPKYLEIDTDAPDTLGSEESTDVTILVTGSPPIEGAEVTIEIVGPGTIDISEGTTDENGQLTFRLTAENVTGEDDHIFIWVNGSMDGYEDGMYDRVVSVHAYVPPRDMIITSSLPDTMKSEQVISMVITVKDGDTPIEGVYLTLRATGPGDTCKNSGTTDENGQVFCSLKIDNVTGEDSTVTVYFNGTLDGYNKGVYTKDVHVEAWIEPVEGDVMIITTNIPSIMYSDQIIPITVTVKSGGVLQGVDMTLLATGPGHTCKDHGVSDSEGHVSCALTIHNVTGDDSVVIVYINGTKDGYQNVYYEKAVTVKAWNPPLPEVVLEPILVDLDGDSAATVIAGVQGNLTIEVQSVTNPGSSDADAIGLYVAITQSGIGTLNWVYIRIDYDHVPAGISPEELRMYHWDEAGEQWRGIINSGVNTVERYVWANVTHLTVFAPRQDPDDTTPPSITYTPITKGKEGTEITIKAAITDVGDGVQEAILYYRTDGQSQYTPISMTKSGTSYKAILSSENVSGKDILYYIEATDGSNIATHPADNANPHVISIEGDGGNEGGIPGFGILLAIGALAMVAIFARAKRKL